MVPFIMEFWGAGGMRATCRSGFSEDGGKVTMAMMVTMSHGQLLPLAGTIPSALHKFTQSSQQCYGANPTMMSILQKTKLSPSLVQSSKPAVPKVFRFRNPLYSL